MGNRMLAPHTHPLESHVLSFLFDATPLLSIPYAYLWGCTLSFFFYVTPLNANTWAHLCESWAQSHKTL